MLSKRRTFRVNFATQTCGRLNPKQHCRGPRSPVRKRVPSFSGSSPRVADGGRNSIPNRPKLGVYGATKALEILKMCAEVGRILNGLMASICQPTDRAH